MRKRTRTIASFNDMTVTEETREGLSGRIVSSYRLSQGGAALLTSDRPGPVVGVLGTLMVEASAK